MLKRFAYAAVALVLTILPLRAEETPDAFEALKSGDYQTAFQLSRPLAEAGDQDAQHLLGFLYENGLGVEKNLQQAVDLYVKAARTGQPDAQFSLGELAFAGDGVQQNAKTAAGWYKLAARQGHPRAKIRLGVMHVEGDILPLDKARALSLFREAAEAGEPEAQRNLAIAYLSGDGLIKSKKEASVWFEKAASTGDPISHYNLALIKGENVATKQASVEHMRSSAEAGFPPALIGLGLLLHDGALEIDGVTPADLFERAAQAGEPQGMFLYAVALAEGDGREQDKDAARGWLDKLTSVENLDPALAENARKLRKRLNRRWR